VFLCILMSVYQFTSYVVTVVCQLLINGYVMLCCVTELMPVLDNLCIFVSVSSFV